LKNTFNDINDIKYGLENMIFQDFVEVYGLDDFDTSIDALIEFTINCSSEFAIRQFILKYPKKTMTKLKLCAKDKNEHIRRLSSEGCRPRLPWAIALQDFKKDPKEVLEILEILKNDPSVYVRKSVANNLNDISKENPDLVIAIIKKWQGENKNTDWMLKHGARTLLKDSNKEVLKLFGFEQIEHISLKDFDITKNLNMTEELNFSFCLNSNENLGKLRVEYAIEFVRQNNKSSKKVFKIAEANYKENQKHFIKKYSFRPITTRKYYAGVHKLFIIVNGVYLGEKEFVLK
jgi:3-methyladenine DNA glycosylase AlkC